MVAPRPRVMKSGVPSTLRQARTGLFTPPGNRRDASSNSFVETGHASALRRRTFSLASAPPTVNEFTCVPRSKRLEMPGLWPFGSFFVSSRPGRSNDSRITAAPMNRPDAVDTSAEQAWQRARALLLSKLGQTAFDLGVKSLRLFAADAETVRLVAPSTTAATWIQTHHPGALEDALRSAGLPTQRRHRRRRPQPGRAVSIGARRRAPGPMRFGYLVPRYTFDDLRGRRQQSVRSRRLQSRRDAARATTTTRSSCTAASGSARRISRTRSATRRSNRQPAGADRLSERGNLHDAADQRATPRPDGGVQGDLPARSTS